jgi:hypothetical protein
MISFVQFLAFPGIFLDKVEAFLDNQSILPRRTVLLKPFHDQKSEGYQ